MKAYFLCPFLRVFFIAVKKILPLEEMRTINILGFDHLKYINRSTRHMENPSPPPTPFRWEVRVALGEKPGGSRSS